MIKNIRYLDTFSKNIILVFLGASLVNFLNLLYQLFIAHRLEPADFAAFNSLLSIFVLISSPIATLQIAVAKYSSEFKAKNQIQNIQALFSNLLKKGLIMSILTLFIFYLCSLNIINKLKIPSASSVNILAILLAISWIVPILSGGLQGLELFKWFTSISVVSGVLKLTLAFIFIWMGFNIAGALGALLFSTSIGVVISFFPLKNFISMKAVSDGVDFKEFFVYLFPVAISSFCFMSLVNFDMVLVKYFFVPEDSGLYSLAQMVGKIFLFFPGAISTVMFPRVSGLNAANMNTSVTLKKSLLLAIALCLGAGLFYNLFPGFVLKILTGKAFGESIILGRLFSVSMGFFALLYILITYFLSIKDMRFIKYLVFFTGLQFLAIVLFHSSLFHIQWILCINSILLFVIHAVLIIFKKLKS
jgi:O-antigen/teichoic acid export membrane protein